MGWNLIESHHGCTENLIPEILTNSQVKDDSSEGLKDCKIESFNKSVLLRGVGVRESLADGVLSAVLVKFAVGEFSASVHVDEQWMIS